MRTAPSSHELLFGTRWSLFGLCAALLYVAGCDLIIPPDNNKPRYNSVTGEKRRPMLNPGGESFKRESSSMQRQSSVAQVYGAPESMQSSASLTTQAAPLAAAPAPVAAAPVAAVPALPPAPKGAEKRVTQAPRSAESEEKGFWSRLAFWRDDESVAPKVMQEAQRQLPVENRAQLAPVANVPTEAVQSNELAPLPGTTPRVAMKSSGEYPTLSDTPNVPSAAMNDNTRQRLGAAGAELSLGRAEAEQAKAALARDVAAQPPLMADVPAWQKTTAVSASSLPPPLPPVAAKPLAPIASAPVNAPVNAPASVAVSTPVAAAPVAVANVPFARATPALEPIRLTPPGPDASIANAMPAQPMGTTLEPIRLTPPAGIMAAAPMSTPPGVAQGSSHIRMKPPRNYAQGEGFLPSSRYSQRRSY